MKEIIKEFRESHQTKLQSGRNELLTLNSIMLLFALSFVFLMILNNRKMSELRMHHERIISELHMDIEKAKDIRRDTEAIQALLEKLQNQTDVDAIPGSIAAIRELLENLRNRINTTRESVEQVGGKPGTKPPQR